jgi:predicted RNA binding protein YcfA (HicA-like mRNA interferase family)
MQSAGGRVSLVTSQRDSFSATSSRRFSTVSRSVVSGIRTASLARMDLRCPRCDVASGSIMKVREVLRLLREDGWFRVATRGSHKQLKHPTKPGRVTVAGHPNDDLAPGTLKSILVQAGMEDR